MKHLEKDQIASYVRQSYEGENPELNEAPDVYEGIWSQAESLRKDYEPPSVDESWRDLNQRKKRRFRNRVLFPWISGAAASLLLFALYFNFYTPGEPPKVVSSTKNPILDQPLSDGSTFSIMARSEISFQHNKQQRALALSGGGFFEVARDPTKPFVVNTNQFQVEVLGTSFYVNDGTWGQPMVVVEEGLVNVRFNEHSVKIEKGEAVILDMLAGTYDRLLVQNHNFLAWKTGELMFDTTPIAEVIQVLETNFQTKLDFDRTSQAMLTASFKAQNLDNILYLIQKTLNLKIQEIDE